MLHLTFSGCPPALLFEVKQPGCSSWIRESVEYLEKESAIKNVLLGFRYSGFLFGGQLHAYPDVPDINPKSKFSNPVPAGDLRELYWNSFFEIVSRLRRAGKQVYLLYPLPELPMHIEKAAYPFSLFQRDSTLDLTETVSAAYYMQRNEFILPRLDSLSFGEGLYPIKPLEILCSDSFCPAVIANQALYFDDNHLSVAGARYLLSNSKIARDLANDAHKTR